MSFYTFSLHFLLVLWICICNWQPSCRIVCQNGFLHAPRTHIWRIMTRGERKRHNFDLLRLTNVFSPVQLDGCNPVLLYDVARFWKKCFKTKTVSLKFCHWNQVSLIFQSSFAHVFRINASNVNHNFVWRHGARIPNDDDVLSLQVIWLNVYKFKLLLEVLQSIQNPLHIDRLTLFVGPQI